MLVNNTSEAYNFMQAACWVCHGCSSFWAIPWTVWEGARNRSPRACKGAFQHFHGMDDWAPECCWIYSCSQGVLGISYFAM